MSREFCGTGLSRGAIGYKQGAHIEGLSPAISVEQKTTSRNPRSTVGTLTEIYDYLRLLYARVGVPYSPTTGLMWDFFKQHSR